MTELEELFLLHRPINCKSCKGKMKYIGRGEYECMECGEPALDDFGKIRQCLEDHPGLNAMELEALTGVDHEITGMFLKEGRITIPKNSKIFIKCERCGCSLTHGRFCFDCTRELASGLKTATYVAAGEKVKEPENKPKSRSGKMRFMNKD